MSKRMPLHVHALVDSLAGGGAELLLGELAAVAPAAGIELSVGYLQKRGGSPGAERLRASGVEPTLVGIPGHLYPSALRSVHRHLAAIRPQVVHTHLGNADLLGALAARSLHIPAVSTIHEIVGGDSSATTNGRRAYAKAWLAARARRSCDARVIAVSEAARTSYLETGWDRPERVVTLHNGISLAAQPGAGKAVRAELGLGSDDLVVATLSALRPEKAHDITFAAFGRLAARFPSLRLVVIGDGPGRGEVERAAAQHGDRVVLAGYRPDVMGILDGVDVLLNPSRSDAFPTALLEAMAAGVPVVASAVGGIPEIVEDGVTGLLVAAPPDAEALAVSVARLLEDAGLRERMGVAGRERFEQRFTAAGWAARLRELYEQVL
jgi:glycosyltransferase involved in cell wall biosynthesis